MEPLKTVLITGATSGIGEATARLLAKDGSFRLILCGRRVDRLELLKAELSQCCSIVTRAFDVRDREAMHTAIDSLEGEFSRIDILINNAGNAHGMDPFQSGSEEDWEQMLDINVKGLLMITRKISPSMVAQGSGQIINVGSIAGKEPYPNGNVYCASKAAVDAVTQGMRMDLHMHNIRVSAIHPGLVETEFSQVRFKGDEAKAGKVYEGITPLSGHDIAETIAFIIRQPEHVVIADLIIFPTCQSSATRVHRHT